MLEGIEFKAVCVDAGDRKSQSRWIVILSKGGQSLETSYTEGSAHRRVKKTPLFPVPFKGYKRGQRVPQRWNQRLSVDEAHFLETRTEPIPPTLESVVECLVMDADCVRHGQTFEDFAVDMGLDTDSRKAEKTYNACRDIWAGLIRLGLDKMTHEQAESLASA